MRAARSCNSWFVLIIRLDTDTELCIIGLEFKRPYLSVPVYVRIRYTRITAIKVSKTVKYEIAIAE